MANNQLIAIIPFLVLTLVVHLTTADNPTPPVEKVVEVGVEGVVYCQSCEHYGTWSFTDAKPIALATVSVICKDHINKISYYKAFQTNKDGYFYAELKGYKMSHSFLDHPLHSCKVRLVASPLKECNLPTNINYGLYGAPLRYENNRLVGPDYEAVVYAAGPLAFRPALCALKEEQEVHDDQLLHI